MGDKEATQLHALLSVSELSSRDTGTNHGQTLKEVMGLVTSPWAFVVYVVICGLISRQ